MPRSFPFALVVLLVGWTWPFLTRAAPAASEFEAMTVKDPQLKLVWLRCSIGQHWNGKTCLGEARALTFSEAKNSVNIARGELEGDWRLPQAEELESLVCRTCPPPKINSGLFPRTALGAYWSETPNALNDNQYWSVSFQSGYSFGRNPPDLTHFVRLVRSFTPLD